jgi:hypothetical protein
MKYPKINISTDYSDYFEAQYLCFLAKGISCNTYQDGGFLVLPTLEKGSGKTVHFPDLGYSKEFWRSINFNPNINLSTQFPTPAIDEAKNLLTRYGKGKFEPELKKIKTDWLNMQKPFWQAVEKFLDFEKAIEKINRIDVLITPFGTKGSFNPPRIGNKFNLKVTSRVDFPAGNIAAGILQNLFIIQTRIGGEIGDAKFIKRMSVINFLFENTVFKNFYPKFQNITKTDFNYPEALVKRSEKYLTKLGFPSKKLLLDIKNKIFTAQESQLLELLTNYTGEVVTFDQVADILWKDNSDEKYSLSAMAKVIENLRRKIKTLGINKQVIFTKRGEGYVYSA